MKIKQYSKAWRDVPFGQGFSNIVQSAGAEIGAPYPPSKDGTTLVETGKLLKNLKRPRVTLRQKGLIADISISTEYAPYVFFGTKRQPARMFMGWSAFLVSKAEDAWDSHYNNALAESNLIGW